LPKAVLKQIEEVKVLKKTFLAVSVGAALASAGAQATPTFDYTQALWTNQAQAGVDNFAIPDVAFTLGTEYTDNDTVTFTWSVDVDGSYSTSLDGTPANAKNFADMKLGLLSSTSNSATYRVVTLVPYQAAGGTGCLGEVIDGTETADGDDCPIVTTGASFTLTDDGVTDLTIENAEDGSGLTGAFQAIAQGGAALDGTETAVPLLDENGAGVTDDTTNLFAFQDQYASNAAGSSGVSKVIEVDPASADDRKGIFTTAGANSVDEDTIVVDFTEVTGGHLALTTGLVITVSGDFSWVYDNDATTAGIQPIDADIVRASDIGAVSATVALTSSSATFTYASAATAQADPDLDLTGGVTITFDNDTNDADGAGAGTAKMEIEDTAFTVSSVIEYTPVLATYTDANNDNDADVVATYAAAGLDLTAISSAGGTWSYNGSVVDVYAMPTSFARNLPFIWLTNSGAESGEVFAVATTEDGTEVDMGEIGTIGSTEIKSFSTAVQDALTAEGITTGRVTLELTTSVPACDINVSAQYYNISSTDRAALETSQTIGNVYSTDDDSADANRCNL
jgi:hypothetical protein